MKATVSTSLLLIMVLMQPCFSFVAPSLHQNSLSHFSSLHQQLQRQRVQEPLLLHHSVVSFPVCSPSAPVVVDDSITNNRHSASDWLYNVRTIPQSAVLREVRNPVLSLAGWAGLVSLFHKVCAASAAPVMQNMAKNMCIPGTSHGFLVSALGLLLVFRTNSAYQRFYEGRKIWENILSVSRNFSRMIKLYENDVGPDRQLRILNLVAAYPYLLRHHIRPGCLCEENKETIEPNFRFELQERPQTQLETRHDGDKASFSARTNSQTNSAYSPITQRRSCWVDRRKLPWSLFDLRSLGDISKTANRPLWVCDRLGQEIVAISYNPSFTSRERLSLLGQVEKLTNAIGQCERIHQTAVPVNYARHSLRSLTLWLFTLPFALVKDLGLLTAPVLACTAWLLLGVYQIGYSIEDPFQGSLRLSNLCDAIRRDVIGDNKIMDNANKSHLTWENGNLGYAKTWDETDPFHLDQEQERYQLTPEMQLLFDAPKIVQDNHGHWNVVNSCLK